MERRQLDITLDSANDLKDVNLFSKMDVYAVVSLKGSPDDSKQKQRTPVHKDSGPNPKWNHHMTFSLDEASLQNNGLLLKFELKSDRSFGDRDIGELRVPVKEIFDAVHGNSDQTSVSYGVRTPSGKTKGTLSFTYKFGEKFAAPAQKAKKVDEPVMAYPPPAGYPVAGASSAYPAPGAYPPPPPPGEAGKAHAPYPYPYPYPPPPQHAYGGYPPQHAPGYGYPGYGGYPQVQAPPPQKPKKSGKGNMALGLGAGLLGGLLVGDMISDVGEMAAYDDGGFDGGFDF